MVRTPCCEKMGVKKGPWTAEEDHVLVSYIQTHGHSNWRALPKMAGLNRCGKSCRLRWANYLCPDIKRGNFTKVEEDTIIRLHAQMGNRWSAIAAQLPGRTDNEIKNVWHTYLKKRLPQGASDAKAPVVRRRKKLESLVEAPAASVSPSTLTLKRQKQEFTSPDDLMWPPAAEDELSTSCSSSLVSVNSEYSDDLVDFSSMVVAELDEAFWTEVLAVDVASAAEDRLNGFAPCGGSSCSTACSWPETITTSNSSGSATTCRTAEAPFEDGTDFWLRMLAEAGNLPLF